MSAFYDKTGRPVVYAIDCGDLYRYSGEPVGYLDNGSVYSFPGQHLGWYAEGWIRDHLGEPALFTLDATGFPIRPATTAEPARGPMFPAPRRAPKEATPRTPTFQIQWSMLSSERFFTQE